MSNHKIRAGILTIREVMPYLCNGKHEFLGHEVNTTSKRLRLFKRFRRNLKCVRCGIEASFFAVEKTNEDMPRYHLALYGLNSYGHEVMMTQDHIRPKSKNGPNAQTNLQLMCIKCNHKKGDKYDRTR